jgi:two-component system cell cycle sensor histidine kinase/response regulator CckA
MPTGRASPPVPSPVTASFEDQRRATVLTWLLLVALTLGTIYDLLNLGTGTSFVGWSVWIVVARDLAIIAALILTRLGWTRAAAAAAMALAPLMVTVRLATATVLLPELMLAYMVIDVVGASILLGERATVAFAALNLAVIGVVGWGVADLELRRLGPAAILSTLSAGLLIAGIRHRRRIEAANRAELAANEARKTSMLESAFDAIVSMDASGRIVEFNPAAERTFQRRRDDVLGSDLADLMIPERERAAHRRGLQRHLESGTSRILGRRIEVTALRADGTEFPCELAIAASPGGDQPIFTAFLRDLTERNDAQTRRASLEQQLRDSQKMQAVGQLAGGVAHDFNNILQAVGGYLTFAIEEARRTAPALAAELEAAEQATQRAAGSVRQLLTFSRRQPMALEPTALSDVVAGFLPLVRRSLTERIALEFVPDRRLPLVRADHGQLQQVLLNLCLNARDAMPDGGRLTLSTSATTITDAFAAANPWARPGQFVVLAVTDSGAGMTAEVRARIFEPFFSTKGVEHGTGLGLAVVYGIVEQHQGFVRVDSAPGEGTTFRIYLPAIVEAGRGVAAPTPPAPPGGSETVLLADDTDAVRDVTRRMLEGAGYHVLDAADGHDALATFERNPAAVHLAVLDAVMPGLNGPDLFTRMRAVRPDLPAIFLSGYSADTIGADWLAEVGAELVMKPVSRHDLLARVRAVLDARRPTPAARQR